MKISDTTAAGAGRRVVMLVDNGVNGDSRVQKSAAAAAAAGWDVILLGCSRAGEPQTWRLGDAEVRLLPLKAPLARRRHEYRRRWLIAPFAYPPTGVGGRRKAEMKAWRADLATRRVMRASMPAARRGKASGALLRAEAFAAKLTGRWVSFRNKQLARGQRLRKPLNLPTDRLYTWFWLAARGDRAWRRLEPGLWDYEFAYGPVIDALAPDLIHANDFRMLGVGARAAARARAKGRHVKLVWDAHEFLPGAVPWVRNERWRVGMMAAEREYAPCADAVITVSATLAELLQQTHKLPQLPDVVLNAPDVDPARAADAPDLRAVCGLTPDVPLIVYSGVAAEKRGLNVLVDALPDLPDVHAALVVGNTEAPYVASLRKRAEESGAADRLHVVPYVAHWHVVPFLSGADVGVIPIRHFQNHEIALITKFFEYSHARLPIVVSDVRTMAEMVHRTGQGEVFRADDVADFARAVRAVLADRDRYRAAYDAPGLLDEWTWEAQARVLDDVYRRVLAIPKANACEISGVTEPISSAKAPSDRLPTAAPPR